MMKTINKTLYLEKLEFYTTHLLLVNAVLPVKLNTKEIEVLAHFMNLDVEDESDRFNFNSRKVIRTTLNISHAGLSNYIAQLRDKNFITGSRSNIKILPLIFPEKDQQIYDFKIINLDNNEE